MFAAAVARRQTYHDHDPYKTLSNVTMLNRSLMLGTCPHITPHTTTKRCGYGVYGTSSYRSLMLGAEVDMWGEGIDDTNFIPFVFPKTTAAAERMWSVDDATHGGAGSGFAEGGQVKERLMAHRCSIVAAGVNVGPIGPGPPCGRVRL